MAKKKKKKTAPKLVEDTQKVLKATASSSMSAMVQPEPETEAAPAEASIEWMEPQPIEYTSTMQSSTGPTVERIVIAVLVVIIVGMVLVWLS